MNLGCSETLSTESGLKGLNFESLRDIEKDIFRRNEGVLTKIHIFQNQV